MTTSTSAFGKANACAALKKALSPTAHRTFRAGVPRAAASGANGGGNGNGSANGHGRSPRAGQRELFMDILGANATRRDAKQYLARFKAPPRAPKLQDGDERSMTADRLDRTGVNLGSLYAPPRAIAGAAKFVREEVDVEARAEPEPILHTALVCLRAPETLDDVTVEGLAVTLSQLVKLDMRIVLVLDLVETAGLGIRGLKAVYARQAQRLADAIQRHSPEASRFVPGALEQSEDGTLSIPVPALVLEPLKRRMIPIIAPLAFSSAGQLNRVNVGDAVAALTRLLASTSDSPTSLDRLIMLDPLGGIPSRSRADNAHVFINLRQEYEDIQKELARYSAWDDGVSAPNMYAQHAQNLDILQRCLELLPSASSALIISPQEAAASSLASQRAEDTTIGAGTRRQKNTLIHNLLTNKPTISSSLPTARLTPSSTLPPTPSSGTATLVKLGMPVSIVPPPHPTHGWLAPASGLSAFRLDHSPAIDLPRLVHLINDSFRRTLDVDHYLTRLRDRTAGVIIAGDYEGAAIFTWETPPPISSSSSSSSSPPDPTRLVPYLDKFAVLQSSQGSAGVADILFQSMVRTCFPRGVCWRSRRDNPVNKWYFERCVGSWTIPRTNWTLFWTGEGVLEEEGRWEDYVAVCRAVEPSWADGGKRPD